MGAETRIQHLLDTDKRKRAEEFANAIRYEKTPVDIIVNENSIILKTELFRGQHDIITKRGNKTISKSGEYEII